MREIASDMTFIPASYDMDSLKVILFTTKIRITGFDLYAVSQIEWTRNK
jgi:hypothetical protein